jgi:hypothetical protein
MVALEPRLFPVEQRETTSDDYYTPAWVFERMGIRFDLDVCAPPGGIPWIPADRFFTMADDGLAQPWHGRVWMNPPYSNSTPWVERFITHRHGIALVQMARAHWCHRLWREADAVVLATADDKLFEFIASDGTWQHVYMPVHFAAFGDDCVEAIAHLGRVRR